MASTRTDSGATNPVVQWFGAGFERLHPLLQALHRNGGGLSGEISLKFGPGLAGVVGRRLVRRLGIPVTAGSHHLEVQIDHDTTTLHWNRCFDRTHVLRSSFRPRGHWPDGYWIENTGPLELDLAVAVIDGGWHWRVIAVRLRGIRVPLWLFPRACAYKRIEDGQYRFFVGFSLPWLGEVFSYDGLLATRDGTPDRSLEKV